MTEVSVVDFVMGMKCFHHCSKLLSCTMNSSHGFHSLTSHVYRSTYPSPLNLNVPSIGAFIMNSSIKSIGVILLLLTGICSGEHVPNVL